MRAPENVMGGYKCPCEGDCEDAAALRLLPGLMVGLVAAGTKTDRVLPPSV